MPPSFAISILKLCAAEQNFIIGALLGFWCVDEKSPHLRKQRSLRGEKGA
jgi:hypothetical protein